MRLRFGTGLVEGIVVSYCLFGWIHFSPILSTYLVLSKSVKLFCSLQCCWSLAFVSTIWLLCGWEVRSFLLHYPSHKMSQAYEVKHVCFEKLFDIKRMNQFANVHVLTLRWRERNWCIFCFFFFLEDVLFLVSWKIASWTERSKFLNPEETFLRVQLTFSLILFELQVFAGSFKHWSPFPFYTVREEHACEYSIVIIYRVAGPHIQQACELGSSLLSS